MSDPSGRPGSPSRAGAATLLSRVCAIAAVCVVGVVALWPAGASAQGLERSFTGSIQVDYLAVPTEDVARRQAVDGTTVELSLKLTVDHSDNLTTSVKVCFACHGFEVGMAYFDIRFADEFNIRVGRFTPAFGEFPLRHDPANHRTSDKPLPYDMGRMLRIREWNMSVLPAPWVDNGVEINGTSFSGDAQLDYAVYAIGGPRAGRDAVDFDFVESRTPALFYVDNNSRPTVGARLGATFPLGDWTSIGLGLSGMYGTYDPDNELAFTLVGAHVLLRMRRAVLRGEYLIRRTDMSLGDDPASRFRFGPNAAGEFDDFFVKHGFYAEAEVPLGDRLDVIARFDGLRRAGNVVAASPLRSLSYLLRYTAGVSYRVHAALRVKASVEVYDFSDFDDEIGVHLGLAGPF